jgi:glutamate-ammonia-ligase adenylyltransferase
MVGSTPLLFRDPAQAGKSLARLEEEYLRAGCNHPPDDFSSALRAALGGLPDPAMALNNLLRFAEASVSRTTLFNDLVEYPVIREVLLAIFSQSQYLSDILVRDPGLFRWLTTTDVLHRPLDTETLRQDVRRIWEMFARPERRMDALRRLYRREILRVGAQDILEKSPVELLTRQLSDLADVLIEAALASVTENLTGKLGVSPPTPYVVLGLGKLGGRELNYSSDVDLICVYGEDGEEQDQDGRTVSRLEFFHQLTERLVQSLSVATGEGHLYRVDMRLRPEGGGGPLARSLASTLTYYESRGELWERQMLIKARVVAGDPVFGADLLARLEPFVYPRTLFQHPSHYVARIKAKIESVVGDERNVKLMPGGIRDIEFSVQVLQLLHGGRDRSLRAANTLEALQRLAECGLITRGEADGLAEAYRFFRTVEHRLQMLLNTQRHSLPDHPDDLLLLARRLGFADNARFEEEALRHRTNVKNVFNDLVAGPVTVAAGGETDPLTAMLEGRVDQPVLERKLKDHGFRSPRQSLAHVRTLAGGSSLSQHPEFEERTREALRGIASRLFAELTRAPDPDLAIANLSAIVSAHRFPHQFFTQLAEDGFRKFVLQVCFRSPWVARELARDPLLMEGISVAVEVAPPAEKFTAAGGDPARYKSRREVGACVKNLLGFTSFGELSRELSEIADTLVVGAFDQHAAHAGMALFALGKFGSRELNFRGDLDILFVSRGADPEEANRAATGLLRDLTGTPGHGGMYDVDIRLRPEGKNAPPVADVAGFARYLQKRVSLWERQSFTRLRFVCGDAGVAREVLELTAGWVYESPLPAGWIRTVVEMRRRMEPRSQFKHDAPVNLKRSSGGMVDIEFVTQVLQLWAGREAIGMRGRPVPEILGAPCCAGGITQEERDTLGAVYLRYREIEKMMRICLEEKSSVLPDGEKLERLARCLDGTSGAVFQEGLLVEMKRVRRLFLAICQRLEETGR